MSINDEVLNDKEPSLSQLAQKRINDHILSRVLLLLGALGLVAGFGIWSTIDGFQDSLRRDTGDSFSDLQRELESKIREDMDEFQNEIESSLRINVDELRNKTTESLDEARISAEITKNQALQTQQEIVRIDAEARLASSNISAVQSTAEEIGKSADELSKFLLRNTPFQNRIVDALQSTVLKRMVWKTPILKEGWTNFDSVAFTQLRVGLDSLGYVYLEGTLKGGVDGNIMVLPESHRPKHDLIFPVFSNNTKIARLDVSPTGTVHISGSDPVWVSLDGIVFTTE